MRKLNIPGTFWYGLAAQCAKKARVGDIFPVCKLVVLCCVRLVLCAGVSAVLGQTAAAAQPRG